jgi:pimeloyl-ACP methyl ester carboxylesterase
VARFFSRVHPLIWLVVFTLGLAYLILVQRFHDTGKLASWPVLRMLAGELYYQIFDKPSVAIGRLAATVVVAGFTYTLVTVLWVPLRRILGWLLLPLGMSSLRAYGTHLLLIVLVYNVDLLAGLYDRSRTGNTVLQAVTVGLTFAVITIWARLERGIGVDVGAGLIPSLLAYPRQRPLIAGLTALAVVVATATVLMIGPVRASRSVDPTEMTADAGLLRYVPPGAASGQPVPVLLVLHGDEMTGPETARPLLAAAERNGWAVIAPTFNYGDWSDPEQVVGDMLVQLPLLRDLVQPGEEWGEQALGERVLVLGEGRGAHTAIAFSLFYPESTAAVATVGPAPCTVPTTAQLATPDAPALPFPFGVDDLEQYVGDELDNGDLDDATRWIGILPDDPAPVNTGPWGALAERAPEDRAGLFVNLLRRAGARAEVAAFRGADALETARASAVQFLTREPVSASP